MKTHSIDQNSFKGYDARPLKGFIMNSNNGGIASEMLNIGKKEGFKIFSVSPQTYGEKLLSSQKNVIGIWAQDFWTILQDNILFKFLNESTDQILTNLNLKKNPIQEKLRTSKECIASIKRVVSKEIEIDDYFDSHYDNPYCEELMRKTKELKLLHKNMIDTLATKHIPGGNMFIIKNNNSNEILVGKNETFEFEPDEIMDLYSTDKITIIPQMDYHLDLFIRPLDNKRVLLTDDKMTLKVFETAIKKLEQYFQAQNGPLDYALVENYKDIVEFYQDFKLNIEKNKNPKAESVEKVLQESGFEVIRVPGRIYEVEDAYNYTKSLLRHKCNYINANVLINDNDELVYITNKSNLDEDLLSSVYHITGISFENEFIKSISPYVKKDHIYFIKGKDYYVQEEMLWQTMGGIHCACTEIPKEID